MEERIQKTLSEDEHKTTLRACILHLLNDLDKNKPPSIAETDLFKDLSAAMQKSLAGIGPKGNPIAFLGMAAEELTTILAPVIVAMASIPPGHLQRSSHISEDDATLLRRGIEDSILEMIALALKHKVLEEHLRYGKFSSKLNKEKK